MGERIGNQVDLEISNVAHGGVMVARLDGRVVFVSDAIPGEVVRAVITDDSKEKFWRADTVSVSSPSEHRQEHIWEAASLSREAGERAGGAEFGHITPAHQRELKRRVLTDALSRMADINSDVVVEPIPGRDDGTGWRTRVHLHVSDSGVLGPYAARSHRVIPVTELPLATDRVVAAVPLGTSGNSGPVDIIAPSVGDVQVLTADSPPVTVRERVGDRQFQLDAGGFWQVHEHAALTLTSAVQQAFDPALFDPGAKNLDLYGGVGLLAAALADRFPKARITSVESDAGATRHAMVNLAPLGAQVVTDRVDRYLNRPATDGTTLAGATVVLDPPRAGAGKGVVKALARLEPAQLVYVACDPVALARDLALFQAAGYRLTGLRAFDLFPNTHHIEAVASLVKA
ncbi:MAG: TRAM domain-containing protein [Terrimesophilobacter sp.]